MSSALWRWLVPLAAAIAVVALLVRGLGFASGMILACPFVGLVLAMCLMLFSGQRTLTVATTGSAVRIGERKYTRDDIDAVAVDPYAPFLRIELPGKTLTVDVPLDIARRIEAILTFEPRPLTSRRTFVVESAALASPARKAAGAGTAVLAALAVGFAVAMATKVLFAALALVATLAVALFVARRLVRRTRVTIGSDGVFLRNGGVSRFVARSAIAALEEPATLVLDGGATIDLRASRRERSSLRRAILDQRSRTKRTASSVIELARLAAAAPGEWIDALRREAVEPSYRTASVEDSVRWRVAKDETATPEQRAAAAISVATTEETRERVRVIASAVAAPELRAVLDAVADDDEAALAEAVSALPRTT